MFGKKITLGGKHISFKKLKKIAEGLGIDLVKHTKGYDKHGKTTHKTSASTILKRVKDKIKSDGWDNTREFMHTIELNKPTAKMPEYLTGMISTSAMLLPDMMSTPTQTGLDDFLQSLLNSEGKSSKKLKPEIYNKKTFQNCDDITNKHDKLQKEYDRLQEQYTRLANEFATWQDKSEECNKKINKIKDHFSGKYPQDVQETINFIRTLQPSTDSGKTKPQADVSQSAVSAKKTQVAETPSGNWYDGIFGLFSGGGGADPSGTSFVPTSVPVPPVTKPAASPFSFGKKRKSKRQVKKSPKKSHQKSPKKSTKKPKRKLHTGSRGGTYYMERGKKVYV